MQYKTIILELIQHNPPLHEKLSASKALLSTVENYACLFRDSHVAWTDRLRQAQPATEDPQLTNTALEIALKEIEAALLSGTEPSPIEALSPDDLVEFLRRQKPGA